ncbi:DUF3558 domain-containing protein [Haloechinothrix salitolerans]|uniref:DUF3558 domain-containing protein n=1 Tax=Haloechinothrix salitolerans TaxID=926830 RepID=A0ABW2BTQ8_9PSEU
MRTGDGPVAMAMLTAVTLAGCSGGPSAAPAPDTTRHDTAHTIASLPQRPAELRVDGLNPCTLFDRDTLNALGITQRPERRTDADGEKCVLAQRQLEPVYELHIAAMPRDGVSNWITGDRSRPGTITATPITIAGFPAVRVFPEAQPEGHCDVVVGVARGQALRVRFGTSYASEVPHDRACALSEKAARVAVGALRGKG